MERPGTLRLEVVYMFQRSNEDNLHEIVGVVEVPGAGGKAAMSKSLQCFKISLGQDFAGARVALPDPKQEVRCRLEVGRALGRAWSGRLSLRPGFLRARVFAIAHIGPTARRTGGGRRRRAGVPPGPAWIAD